MNEPKTPEQLLAEHVGVGNALSAEEFSVVEREFAIPEQESATVATARHEESSQ